MRARPSISLVLVALAMSLAIVAPVRAADADTAGAKFLQDERAAHPAVHELWRDIVRSVPESTHLSRLTLDEGAVQADLAWGNAAEVLQAIRASKVLVDAVLLEGIQTDGELGIQHFTVAGKAAPRAITDAKTSFVPGKGFDVGVAQLQLRVEDAIATHAKAGNCTLVTAVAFRSIEDYAFERVTLKVRMRCTEPELRLVLADLESGAPTLFLDSVRIGRQVGHLVPGSTESVVYMDVGFDLVGYIDEPGR